MGGGTQGVELAIVDINGLSPRGRGNLLWPGTNGTVIRVYPRVGGGTRPRNRIGRGTMGLSPRGRGNPGVMVVDSNRHGSIPAWAGEPPPCSVVRQ